MQAFFSFFIGFTKILKSHIRVCNHAPTAVTMYAFMHARIRMYAYQPNCNHAMIDSCIKQPLRALLRFYVHADSCLPYGSPFDNAEGDK